MKDIERLQNSIDYIEDNLEERIELDDLARKAYLSKFHFHRIFHSVVGESVGDYIRKRRLSEAALELKKTDKRIVDIALKYQFSSQEAFSRAFKRSFGLSPTEYRKESRNIILLRRIDLVSRVRTLHKSDICSPSMAA